MRPDYEGIALAAVCIGLAAGVVVAVIGLAVWNRSLSDLGGEILSSAVTGLVGIGGYILGKRQSGSRHPESGQ